MNKYLVRGTTVVTVCKEVWANSEEEAFDKAYDQLHSLTEYCGNGGYDKLIGVDGDDESVSADGTIEYDDIEMLEHDPDYFECPECGEECEHKADVDGEEYWYCESCYTAYDDDGDVVYPDAEEEE